MGRKGLFQGEPGPFGTWEEDADSKLKPILTEEGQTILTAWLKDWPEPSKLYAKVFKREYAWAVDHLRIDLDELSAAAMIGSVRAMWSWDPERGDFSTFAAYFMRAYIQKHTVMGDHKKRNKHGVSVIEGNTVIDSDTGFELLDTLGESDGDPDISSELRSEIQRALVEQVPAIRDREMFNLYYGFSGQPAMTLNELSKIYGITRSRTQQIVSRTKKRIYPDLFGMHRKYIEHAV